MFFRLKSVQAYKKAKELKKQCEDAVKQVKDYAQNTTTTCKLNKKTNDVPTIPTEPPTTEEPSFFKKMFGKRNTEPPTTSTEPPTTPTTEKISFFKKIFGNGKK